VRFLTIRVARYAVAWLSTLAFLSSCDTRSSVKEWLPPTLVGNTHIHLGQQEDSVARIRGIARSETYDTEADDIYQLAIDAPLFDACTLFIRNGHVYSIHLQRERFRPANDELLYDSVLALCRRFYGGTFRTFVRRTDTMVALSAESTTSRGATLYLSYAWQPTYSLVTFALSDWAELE